MTQRHNFLSPIPFTWIDILPGWRFLSLVLNVFRYNKADAQGRQRWAFRFSIANPNRELGKRGRANSLGYVYCAASIELVKGVLSEREESTPFYTEDEAALECDCWKFWLMRHKGAQKIPFSLGSYDALQSAYSLKYDKSIEEMEPSRALQKFLKDERNQDLLETLESYAPSGAWNPHVELYEARKNLAEVERLNFDDPNATQPGQYARFELIKDWAVRFSEHMKLVEQVEHYGGVSKLKAEIDMHVQALTNSLRYSQNWNHPKKCGFYFTPVMEKLEEARTQMKTLLAQMKAVQSYIHTFADKLPLQTQALKDERAKL